MPRGCRMWWPWYRQIQGLQGQIVRNFTEKAHSMGFCFPSRESGSKIGVGRPILTNAIREDFSILWSAFTSSVE